MRLGQRSKIHIATITSKWEKEMKVIRRPYKTELGYLSRNAAIHFFDDSTLFLSWSFSARSCAWAPMSRSRSPLTTVNSDLASDREAVMDMCSPLSTVKEARILASSALADSSFNSVDASRERHSSSPWEVPECILLSLSIWLWSWFLFARRAVNCSNYSF